MFKKLILPTAIIGATLAIGSNHAKADEVDHSELVNLANNNPTELNNNPVQAGAYNINFTDNGQSYHFESNGSTWSWSFGGQPVSQTTQVEQPKVATSQSVSVEPTQAPKVQEVQEPKQEVTTESKPVSQNAITKQESKAVAKASSTSNATGGSVKAQFLSAGGTEAMWNSIVMPESTGNPNASNGQYTGLFQTNQASFNASNSVAQQTKGAIKYAKERYGSVENAIASRESQGWW